MTHLLDFCRFRGGPALKKTKKKLQSHGNKRQESRESSREIILSRVVLQMTGCVSLRGELCTQQTAQLEV